MSLLLWAQAVFQPAVRATPTFSFSRTLERTFSGHPAWGGGNVQDNAVGNRRADFTKGGENWEVWQVIPFDGPAISGVLGACRLHLRNRSKNRGQNLLADMPTRVVLSAGAGNTADWIGLPWSFTRSTNQSLFMNVASGNSARKSVTYIADRASIPANAGLAGIAQGESFTFTLQFD